MFSKKTKPVVGLCAENETGYWFQTTMLNRYRLLAIPEKPVPSPRRWRPVWRIILKCPTATRPNALARWRCSLRVMPPLHLGTMRGTNGTPLLRNPLWWSRPCHRRPPPVPEPRLAAPTGPMGTPSGSSGGGCVLPFSDHPSRDCIYHLNACPDSGWPKGGEEHHEHTYY